MARDLLLAFGVLLATYSQLRFAASNPVGPGEFTVLAWVGCMLVTSPQWATSELSVAFHKLAKFWLIFAAALALGTMTSYLSGVRNSPGHFFHDITAYTLMALVGLLLLAPDDAARRMRRMEWGLVLLGSGMLAAQLCQAYGLMPAFGLELWFFDRLTGWTTNANQLALQCLVLSFIAFHLIVSSENSRERLTAAAGAVLPLVCGYLTRSDAFVLSMVLGLLGYIVLTFGRAAAAYARSRPRRALLMVAVVPVLAGSIASLVFLVVRNPVDLPVGTSESEQRLERDMGYRTELWSQAADRIISSGFLGLGPGPQLVRPANLREPELDTLPDFEAHNTLIDLTLQGGILAAGALIWLTGTTALQLLRQGSSIYALLIASLGIFSMTHFIFRHPIFWFAICAALMAAAARQEAGKARLRQSQPSKAEPDGLLIRQ